MANVAGLNLSESTKSFLQCAAQLLNPQTSPEVRRLADEWLGKFQLNVEAWSAVDEVLTCVSDQTVLFLAAQTLNRKIRYDRDQLGTSPETWDSLRQAVVRHLLKHSSEPVVCTQLALGLVALMIQMETWVNAIPDLLRVLEQKPSIMLEVLRLIPEEVDDPSLDVSAERRFAFKREMLDLTPAVISMLSRKILPQDNRVLFECARAWIAFSDVPGQSLADSKLLEVARDVILKGEYTKDFEPACEVFIETVHRYHTLDSDDVPVLNVVVPGILSLEPTYDAACARKQDDVVAGIARVFAHLAEAYVPLMLGRAEINQTDFVKVGIKVFSHDDFRIARKSYYFLMDLLEGLARMEPPELQMQRVAQLQPFLDHLVLICYKRMVRTPDNVESDDEADVGAASDDEDEDGSPRLSEFEMHRLEVGDVLRRLVYASGDSAQVAHAGPRLAEICSTPNLSVSELEAGLLAFRSVAKDMSFSLRDSANGKAIEVIMTVGIRRANEDVSIRRATCDVVSEVAEHLSKNPEGYVSITTNFLIESIRSQGGSASKHAARAFRHLCFGRCAELLFPELGKIFDALSPYDPTLNDDCRFDLLEGICCIWVAGLCQVIQRGTDRDRAQLGELFERFVNPPLTALSSCVMESQNAARTQTQLRAEFADLVIVALHSLTVFVRFSVPPRSVGMAFDGQADSIPEAVEKILNKLWPALKQFNTLPDKSVEALCRMIKHATRTFPNWVRPNVRTILEFVVSRYQQSPISSNLYITGVIFQEYFDCEELLPYFPSVLSALCSCSFDRVLTTPAAFVQFPDFVEDLFYLGNRTVEYLPDVIVTTDAFDRLIGMGAAVGLALEHREAFRSVTVFLDNAIALGIVALHEDAGRMDDRFRPYVSAALDRHGRTMISTIIQGMAGGLSAERVSDTQASNGTLAHVLFTLSDFYGNPNHFSTLVSEALLGQRHLSNELRGSFLQRLLQATERDDIQQFMTACSEFGWTARRRLKRASA